jgi:hypothetical protein
MMAEEPLRDLSAFQFEVRMEMPGTQSSHLMLQSPEIPT